MKTSRVLTRTLAFIAGLATWLILTIPFGEAEPWDAGAPLLPISLSVAFVMGALFSRERWKEAMILVVFVAAGQAVAGMATGDWGDYAMLVVIVFGLLSLTYGVAAFLGSIVGERLSPPRD